jgi:hypothetical protein
MEVTSEPGRLGSAARSLLGKSVEGTITESVVEALRAKHLAGRPPLLFGTALGPRKGEIPPEDTVLDAFQSFKPDNSTRDFRLDTPPPVLVVALRSPVVLKAFHTLTGLIAAGTAPGQSMLCSSQLTALSKGDGRIQTDRSRRASLQALYQGPTSQGPTSPCRLTGLAPTVPVWGGNQGRGRTSDPCGSESSRRLPRPTIHPPHLPGL